jgi:hypothetical protein
LALFSAVLMGGAVAFFFFAMPLVLLEQGVIASGLPTIIAAAGPPLGATARALVAGTFALLSGGTTWLLITLIGMIGRPRVRRSRDADETAVPLAQPLDLPATAPPRRPIFATAELGAPIADVQEAEFEVATIDQPAANPWKPLEVPLEDVLDLVDTVIDHPFTSLPDLDDELPILDLMARLEAGAERRAAKAATIARAASRSEPPRETTTEFDGALRDALAELQRMAVR